VIHALDLSADRSQETGNMLLYGQFAPSTPGRPPVTPSLTIYIAMRYKVSLGLERVVAPVLLPR